MKSNNKNLGKYASKYFHMTVEALHERKDISVLKFFCFENNITVCGIKFIQKILIEQIEEHKLNNIKIYSLNDGDQTNAKQTVLMVEGYYQEIALFEGIIDGILTRLSSITTNVKKVMKILNGKDLIYMADRNDLYLNQPYDGYAAYIGGIRKFVTSAMLEYIDDQSVDYVGTIPHSLIQQHHGNLIEALISFHQKFPDTKMTALIDYQNDCVGEIEKIGKHWIKEHINAVRIDTSKSLVDLSLQHGEWSNNEELKGVNHHLICNVRKALDKNNLNNVKIIVSSSINEEKIKHFNALKTPIDCYGIGSWFLTKCCHFTADLVKINEQYEAKVGRKDSIEADFEKLKIWNWKQIKESWC